MKENPTAMLDRLLPEVPKPAALLGLGGLIPFWACALGAWLVSLPVALWLIDLQLYYGAVILSFLGAVHWGRALAEEADAGAEVLASVAAWNRLGWSVMPALIGWLALIAPQIIGVGILLIGLGLAFFVDQATVRRGRFPAWYLRLRKLLTLGAVTALAVALGRFFVA